MPRNANCGWRQHPLAGNCGRCIHQTGFCDSPAAPPWSRKTNRFWWCRVAPENAMTGVCICQSRTWVKMACLRSLPQYIPRPKTNKPKYQWVIKRFPSRHCQRWKMVWVWPLPSAGARQWSPQAFSRGPYFPGCEPGLVCEAVPQPACGLQAPALPPSSTNGPGHCHLQL